MRANQKWHNALAPTMPSGKAVIGGRSSINRAATTAITVDILGCHQHEPSCSTAARAAPDRVGDHLLVAGRRGRSVVERAAAMLVVRPLLDLRVGGRDACIEHAPE